MLPANAADTCFFNQGADALIKNELVRRIGCDSSLIEVSQEHDTATGEDLALVVKYREYMVCRGYDGSVQGAVDAAIRGIRFAFPKVVIKP